MAIVSISRGCHSHGEQIANMVAQRLGYECVNRGIILEAAQFFNLSETKLLRSLTNAPSILEKITHGREKYLDCFKAALLEHVKNDDIVYHGHAGHLMLPTITHILKVRIIADMPDRIAMLQKLENIPAAEAEKQIVKDDKERTQWTRFLYKREIQDPSLYDMVINIGTFSIENACDLICHAAKSDSFQTSPEAKLELQDLAISSHIKVELEKICRPVSIKSHNGAVHIKVAMGKMRKADYASPDMQSQVKENIQSELFRDINDIVYKIPGVKHVVCDLEKPDF